MILKGLHRSRNKTLWVLDVGHLALEHKQFQDGLEQGSTDATVEKATAKEKRLMTITF